LAIRGANFERKRFNPQPSCYAATVESYAFNSLLKSVPAVPSLAMRRAVIERELLALEAVEQAVAIEELAVSANKGNASARTAVVALTSWVVHRRNAGADSTLDSIEQAARHAGLLHACSLGGDASSVKSLAPLGRLPEVGLNRDGYFPKLVPPEDGVGNWYGGDKLIFRRFALLGSTWLGSELKPLPHFLLHPSGPFIARVLRTPWIRGADVIRVAARRPSTPEIVHAVAMDDRWFYEPRVRIALAENPFTASWLSSWLRLALPAT
jgi:hypothetical protein